VMQLWTMWMLTNMMCFSQCLGILMEMKVDCEYMYKKLKVDCKYKKSMSFWKYMGMWIAMLYVCLKLKFVMVQHSMYINLQNEQFIICL
jgi:hypothetical protein